MVPNTASKLSTVMNPEPWRQKIVQSYEPRTMVSNTASKLSGVMYPGYHNHCIQKVLYYNTEKLVLSMKEMVIKDASEGQVLLNLKFSDSPVSINLTFKLISFLWVCRR